MRDFFIKYQDRILYGTDLTLNPGEDAQAFHVLGGNQSDRVMIKRIAKNRLLGARRCPWRINQPAAVRPVVLAANGALSTNEA